jgi:Flp pilus assembly protein TadG
MSGTVWARRTRRLLSQRGQATVELALCLPILALVLAAVVEVGVIASDQARLWHAAREAARVAIVDPNQGAAVAAAQYGGLRPLQVSISPRPTYRVQGRPLTVSVSYHPQGGVPVVDRLLSGLELKADATMRIEQP